MDGDKNCFYVDVGRGSHVFLVWFCFLRQALSVALGVLLCSVDQAGLTLYTPAAASASRVLEIYAPTPS